MMRLNDFANTNKKSFFAVVGKTPCTFSSKGDLVNLSWSKESHPSGNNLSRAIYERNTINSIIPDWASIGINLNLNPIDNYAPFCIDVDSMEHSCIKFLDNYICGYKSSSGRGYHYWGLANVNEVDRKHYSHFEAPGVGIDIRFITSAFIKIPNNVNVNRFELSNHTAIFKLFLRNYPQKQATRIEYFESIPSGVEVDYDHIKSILFNSNISKTNHLSWYGTMFSVLNECKQINGDEQVIYDLLLDWSKSDTRPGQFNLTTFNSTFRNIKRRLGI